MEHSNPLLRRSDSPCKFITIGEIMLRLSPPGQSRIFQAQSMDVNYGGAEANVAVSLAQLGHKVSFVSKVPDNALGDAALGVLKKYNADCSPAAYKQSPVPRASD